MKKSKKWQRNAEILTARECEEIAERINELTAQLGNVRANFDFVTDERAIDALIYEENALICRIESLHHEARERGISVQPYQR